MTRKESFTRWHSCTLQRINHRLELQLPHDGSQLSDAMRYATLGAGKRLRPLLCMAAASDCGNATAALAAACSVEMIHSYSLIHDDLPCMDDDDLRRGQPACHVRFGQAMALLAGDALQTLAFAQLAKTASSAIAVSELAQACGATGMVGGQAIDVSRQADDQTTLREMHERKTGALFCCAVRLGAQAVDATSRELRALTDWAAAFGLAFQIADDIADETESAATTGKSPGSDRSAGGTSYVTVLGLPQARKQLTTALQQLSKMIKRLPGGEDSRTRAMCHLVFPAAGQN